MANDNLSIGVGKGITGLTSMYITAQDAKMRRMLYDHNAAMSEYNAWFINRATEDKIEQVRRKGRQELGAVRAAGAASGFALSSVSQQLIEEASIRSLEEDIAAIQIAGDMKILNERNQAGEFRLRGQLAESAARTKQISTLFETVDTVAERFK